MTFKIVSFFIGIVLMIFIATFLQSFFTTPIQPEYEVLSSRRQRVERELAAVEAGEAIMGEAPGSFRETSIYLGCFVGLTSTLISVFIMWWVVSLCRPHYEKHDMFLAALFLGNIAAWFLVLRGQKLYQTPLGETASDLLAPFAKLLFSLHLLAGKVLLGR